MIIIKARNKIIAGEYKEYKFKKKFGELFLYFLEKEINMNAMTIRMVEQLEQMEVPSLKSILFRSYFLSMIFGWLGVIAGTSTAKRNRVYKIRITFADGGVGVAEVNDRIYEALLDVIVNAQNAL